MIHFVTSVESSLRRVGSQRAKRTNSNATGIRPLDKQFTNGDTTFCIRL